MCWTETVQYILDENGLVGFGVADVVISLLGKGKQMRLIGRQLISLGIRIAGFVDCGIHFHGLFGVDMREGFVGVDRHQQRSNVRLIE